MRRRKSDPPFRRVLVPLDASPESRALLELAADLAACFESSLTGLFIEDEDLLAFADLPFAREVSLSGAGLRGLSRQHIQSHYRAQASQARRALETVATQRRIAYSFELKRGRAEPEIHAACQEWDLVAVSSRVGNLAWVRTQDLPERLARSPAAALLILSRPTAPAASGPLAVVYADSPAGAEALRAAGRIAARLSRPLEVVCAAERAGDDTLKRRMGELTEAGQRAHLAHPQGAESLADCLQRAARRPSLVVVPADLAPDDLQALARLGPPLLAVRPAREGGPATAATAPSKTEATN